MITSDKTTHITESTVNLIPVVAEPPTITVYGAGGCGINSIRNVRKDIEHRVNQVHYLDTSFANARDGEAIVNVGSGKGSGKLRSENIEKIQSTITGFTDDELGISDINIIAFSAAGGSGAVIGPVLIREISRRNKLVVGIIVADTRSQIEATNTMGTLRTLDYMATNDDGIYLPVMMFDNNISGKTAVDALMAHRIKQLITILTADVIELDCADRKNWLNSSKVVNLPPGIRMLHVSSELDNESNDAAYTSQLWSYGSKDIYDSVIAIGVPNKESNEAKFVGASNNTLARTMYDGVFATSDHKHPYIGYVAGDNTALSTLIKQIEDRQQLYNVNAAQASVIKTGNSKPANGFFL